MAAKAGIRERINGGPDYITLKPAYNEVLPPGMSHILKVPYPSLIISPARGQFQTHGPRVRYFIV